MTRNRIYIAIVVIITILVALWVSLAQGVSGYDYYTRNGIYYANGGTTPRIVMSKSLLISNPDADADGPAWRTPTAITIVNVHALCIGGTNWVGQLAEYDPNGASGVVVDSSDITSAAGTNANDDGTLSNASIDAGDYVGVITTSVSGSPTLVIVTYEYTEN